MRDPEWCPRPRNDERGKGLRKKRSFRRVFMAFQRTDRVRQQIKREISVIIRDELKDPRVGFITVTNVELSLDLRHAKIYVSIMGDKEEQEKTMKGLKQATGFVRTQLGQRIRLRYTPEIVFRQDSSLDAVSHIYQLLDEVKESSH